MEEVEVVDVYFFSGAAPVVGRPTATEKGREGEKKKLVRARNDSERRISTHP